MALDFKDFGKLAWYYQILLVLFICGGLLFLGWYLYFGQMEEDLKAKNTQLEQLQQTIAKSLQQQKAFQQFKKETEQLQVKLDELKSVLPLARETDQLLRQIQLSAANSALRILRVSPRPLVDHEVYQEWPVDMEVVGTYHNVSAYLDKIRQLPRIVNISGLKLSARASEGEAAMTTSVGAVYTATTFVYREEAMQPAPPAGAKK